MAVVALTIAITGDVAGNILAATELRLQVDTDFAGPGGDVGSGITAVILTVYLSDLGKTEVIWSRTGNDDLGLGDVGYSDNYSGTIFEVTTAAQFVVYFQRDGGWPGGVPEFRVIAADEFLPVPV